MHLAVALGVEALLQGIGVYFTTLSDLLEDLKRAYKENRLDKRLSLYLRPKLFIIDEVVSSLRPLRSYFTLSVSE